MSAVSLTTPAKKVRLALLLALYLIDSGAATLLSPNRYAYDANAGWIDFSPPNSERLFIDDNFLKGYAYSANLGWIHFGKGPRNLRAYSGMGDDYGVNADPRTGELSGVAWCANTGWLSFNWAGANDPNRPIVLPTAGALSGYVWSANTGWMNLTMRNSTDHPNNDSDGDGMDDAWEIQHFGNLITAGIGTDWDGDGQSDAAEYIADTLPKDSGSWLRIVSHSVNETKTVTTLIFTSSPACRYRIETSTDLKVWTPVRIGRIEIFPGEEDSATTTINCPHGVSPVRFHRVIAIKE